MALNPIAYAEHVVRGFLRYQLTAYPFADTRLHDRAFARFGVRRHSKHQKGYNALLLTSMRTETSTWPSR